MKTFFVFSVMIYFSSALPAQDASRLSEKPDSIATHKVVLDSGGRLLSWISPQNRAYAEMLKLRWQFILNDIPNAPGPAPRSDYPLYFFYCAYKEQKMIPDTWMNDVGEKIPNWYESARLYYQYSGDDRPLKIVIRMASYAIDHGTSPKNFAWPEFPYTTTNAEDTLFRGFTDAKRFVMHEVQVDHAADMGLAYFGLFQITGNLKFRDAAIHVADALASHAKNGTAHASVWPYRVVMSDGRVTAPYGANWFPAYELLDRLASEGLGKVKAYRAAMEKARHFILQFPMRSGYWADGHTDTDVRSDTYKSNMSASNATLYLLRHPEFDPASKNDIPGLIGWTEKNFVERCASGEPATQWGANLVGEQDEFLPKMDYQTARYGAECAAWYAITKKESFREKAFRALNWVTYCTDEKGMVFESPVSKGITSWWSDSFGEGPRMIYFAMAHVPDWAPPGENHLLFTEAPVKDMKYEEEKISYSAAGKRGRDYLKLRFKPSRITLNDRSLSASPAAEDRYRLTASADGGTVLEIFRSSGGFVSIEK